MAIWLHCWCVHHGEIREVTNTLTWAGIVCATVQRDILPRLVFHLDLVTRYDRNADRPRTKTTLYDNNLYGGAFSLTHMLGLIKTFESFELFAEWV